MRSLVLAVLAIGLTFSYAILDAMLLHAVSSRLSIRMSLWTLIVLVACSVYSGVTDGRFVPSSVRWTFEPLWSAVAAALVGMLAGLATLFPSPKHEYSDMLYVVVRLGRRSTHAI